MSYEKIKADQLLAKDTNDCSVVSTAVVCDVSYAEAQAMLRRKGRKRNRGYWPESPIREFGFQIREIPISSKTTRTVERELAEKWGGVKVLIHATRHVLGWDGTELADWTAGRCKRITRAFVIFKGEFPVGASVPVPARSELRNRKGHTATAVWVTYDCHTKWYKSMPAAYKALGFSSKGRQAARRDMKRFGRTEVQCQIAEEPWRYVYVEFRKAE